MQVEGFEFIALHNQKVDVNTINILGENDFAIKQKYTNIYFYVLKFWGML